MLPRTAADIAIATKKRFMVTTVSKAKAAKIHRHVSPTFRPMQIKTVALVKHRTTYLLNVFAHSPRQIDSPPPSSTAYCTMPDTRCQAEPLKPATTLMRTICTSWFSSLMVSTVPSWT